MRIRFYIFSFLTLFTLLFSQEELITKYTINDNLPNQSIFDCTQDTLGNMWFATEGGVIKYDGTEWTLIDTLDADTRIYTIGSIKKDQNGNIWAFSHPLNNKAYVYNYSKWVDFQFVEQYDQVFHSSLIDSYVSSSDTVIVFYLSFSKEEMNQPFSSIYDVAIYINGETHFITYFRKNDIRIFDFSLTANSLYICSDLGLYHYSLNDIANGKYDYKNRLTEDIVLTLEILGVSENQEIHDLLFLTPTALIEIKDNKKTIIQNSLNIIYSESPTNYPFVKSFDNEFYYFGTKYIGYSYNRITNKLTTIEENNGYTTKGATNAYVDAEKNTWITSQRGINKIRYTPFASYDESDGFLESEVTSIEKFNDGSILLAHNRGFTLWKNKPLKTIELDEDELNKTFRRILHMQHDQNQDVVWFNSQLNGIGNISSSGVIKWEIVENANKGRPFLSVYMDNSGDIYFADGDGLFKIDQGKEFPVLINPSFNIRAISEYDEEHLLLATRKGVGVVNKFTKKLRLYSSEIHLSNEVYSFLKLDGKWLVGTAGGIMQFDGNSFLPFDNIDVDKPVYFIGKEEDNIWFGLMGGAVRWNRFTGEKKMFTTAEGLVGAETNRDAFLYSNNKVYIGTDRGLSVFIPEIYDRTVYESKPNINNVSMRDDENNPYSLGENFSLPFHNNNLTLNYRSPSFIDETQNKFIIHIINLDEEIVENYETQNTSYTIRNIDPGEYKIGVNAINAYGVSSDTVYSASFSVNEPFYRETWFYIMLFGISISITLALYDYINRNKYSRSLELEVARRTEQLKLSEENIRDLTQKLITAQEMERQRIARDLHDNVAQDLAILNIELNKARESSKSLDQEKINLFSTKLKSLGKIIKDVSFNLHPSSLKQTGLFNSIKALCADFTSLTNIQIEFYSQVNEQIKLSDELETNLYRFVQEALNNIRKHSEAESGIVIMNLQENELQLRIEDDGIGFDRNKISTEKRSKSMGLKSMEERILLVGGKLKIKSLPGEGTKIFATIPIKIKNYENSEANSLHTSG